MILLINPNSTASMTAAMLQTMRETAPGVAFDAWTSHDGPPAIQGREDGEAAVPPLLGLVGKAQDARAIIIGCFDDTGLEAAREIASCPVIGIGQAAYHLASIAGRRFSVVTTLAVSTPILEENIQTYGLSGQLGKVRASDVPVLDLEKDPDAAAEKVLNEILVAERQDNVQSIVLGCAGMVGIAEKAKTRTDMRLIDGVRAAAVIAQAF